MKIFIFLKAILNLKISFNLATKVLILEEVRMD